MLCVALWPSHMMFPCIMFDIRMHLLSQSSDAGNVM